MTPHTRKIILYSSGTLLTGVVVFLIVNKIRKKNMIATIESEIKNGTKAEQAQNKVVQASLNPNAYKNSATEKTVGSTQLLIDNATGAVLMTRPTAQQYADAFYNDHNILLPNDLKDVLQRIGQIGSQRKFSYVSSVFQSKYGTPLVDYISKVLMQTIDPTTAQEALQILPAIEALPT